MPSQLVQEVLLLDETEPLLWTQFHENIEAMIRSLAPAVTIIIVARDLRPSEAESANRTKYSTRGSCVKFDETKSSSKTRKKKPNRPYVTGPMGLDSPQVTAPGDDYRVQRRRAYLTLK